MSRTKLFIGNGYIWEWKAGNDFFLNIFRPHKAVCKVENELIAKQMVDAYNEKYDLL